MSLKFEFRAEDVINQNRTSRTAVDEIRKWMKTHNLPEIQDEQIIMFLLSCNNIIKDTQITILAHYKYKHLAPEFFADRDMDGNDIKHVLTVVDSCVIPRRTKDNYFVIFQRLKDFSYWNFHLDKCIKYLFMNFDYGMMKNPPKGLVVCFDMKGLGLMHLTRLRIGSLKKFFHYVQEGLPCQLKQIHIFNTVYFIDKLMAILKPFIKTELYEMIHFHPSNLDMDKFFEQWIEASCLPSDYGGKQPSYKDLDQKCLRDLYALDDYFRNEENQWRNYIPPK